MVCLIAGGDDCALVNQLSTKPTGDLRKNFSRPHINLLLHLSVLEWAVDSFIQWVIVCCCYYLL